MENRSRDLTILWSDEDNLVGRENNLEDRAAVRCRSDPGRKNWAKGNFGWSVITERLYIDVKQDFKKKKEKRS